MGLSHLDSFRISFTKENAEWGISSDIWKYTYNETSKHKVVIYLIIQVLYYVIHHHNSLFLFLFYGLVFYPTLSLF